MWWWRTAALLGCCAGLWACGDAVGVPIRLARSAAGAPAPETVAAPAAEPEVDDAGPEADSGAAEPAPMPDAGVAVDAGVQADGVAVDAGAQRDVDAASPTRVAEVPDGAHCAAAADWPAVDAAAERWLYDELERLRGAAEFECGQDVYRDLSPFVLSPELRCSARLHSLDMVQRDFLDITNPDGERPPVRMSAAGLVPNRWGELYQTGRDPMVVLERLLSTHPLGCLHLTNPAYSHVGIGYHGGVWTLDFAEPAR